MRTLITGGARSGKSTFAESVMGDGPVDYVATGYPASADARNDAPLGAPPWRSSSNSRTWTPGSTRRQAILSQLPMLLLMMRPIIPTALSTPCCTCCAKTVWRKPWPVTRILKEYPTAILYSPAKKGWNI